MWAKGLVYHRGLQDPGWKFECHLISDGRFSQFAVYCHALRVLRLVCRHLVMPTQQYIITPYKGPCVETLFYPWPPPFTWLQSLLFITAAGHGTRARTPLMSPNNGLFLFPAGSQKWQQMPGDIFKGGGRWTHRHCSLRGAIFRAPAISQFQVRASHPCPFWGEWWPGTSPFHGHSFLLGGWGTILKTPARSL